MTHFSTKGALVCRTFLQKKPHNFKLSVWGFFLSMGVCSSALGQTVSNPSLAPALPKGEYATKMKTIPEPMSYLLDHGYQLVDLAVGLGGVGYLLRDGDKWAACSVVKSAQVGRNHAISHCAALN